MRTLTLILVLLALAQPAAADPTVAIASDSIAVTYPVNYVPPVQGWGAFMPTYIPSGVVWRNDAVGGTSTKSFIALGYWAATIATHPQFILIQFGANDQRIAQRILIREAQLPFQPFESAC